LARMTVAVQSGTEVTSFTKGSFERIRALCRPDTVPNNYTAICQVSLRPDDVLPYANSLALRILWLSLVSQGTAAQGFYTLAVGCKPLPSPEAAARLSRDDLEGDLELLGLLLFRNEPKPEAAEAVAGRGSFSRF
jgi:magnesium-transporting ATPase (P-type)